MTTIPVDRSAVLNETVAPPAASVTALLPDSPHAMAGAVLAEAMAEQQQQQLTVSRETTAASTQDAGSPDSRDDEETSTAGREDGAHRKRPRLSSDDNDSVEQEDVQVQEDGDIMMDKLREAWEQSKDADEVMSSILTLIHGQIDSLIRKGLKAYHAHESKSRDLLLAKEELVSQERELQRLRTLEEQSRTTITNLLRTIETAKSDARDSTRLIQSEARLRADLSSLRSERDQAVAVASEFQRKVELLEEDLKVVKSNLHRVTQDKIKMERDSRAAISLARSLDHHSSSDTDYYKRKVSDLTNQLQTQQALVAEQKHQLEEMRRQMERSMSQNRLSNIRAEQSGKGRSRAH